MLSQNAFSLLLRKSSHGQNLHLFEESNTKCLCLICGETIAVPKVENVKRHYTPKHASTHNRYEGESDFTSKEFNLATEVFWGIDDESRRYAKVSFIIVEKIARNMKSFSEDFVKECITSATEILCSEKEKATKCVSLSRNTMTRRTEELVENTKMQLNKLCKIFEAYSIAIDESTDTIDTPYLVIFVRSVDSSFNITEELLALSHMKGNCTGAAIFKQIDTALEKMGLTYNRLLESLNMSKDQILWYHCILHQQSLCSKIIKFDQDMDNIVKAFRNFFNEINAEFAGIPYFTKFRWLSRGCTLKRFYDIREHVAAFLEAKGNSCINFDDSKWMNDFYFLVDITDKLNELNVRLQGKEKLFHNLFWEIAQIAGSNYAHFPCLQEQSHI
uniref:SPIN-DOC-like zinc-finger domain-containing protein n=1 Tax=Octopus bimaculoides TaxID=37653 RepID=A0A0L8IG87_OCTBM